ARRIAMSPQSEPLARHVDVYQIAWYVFFFFFNDTATTEIYTLSLTTLFRSDTRSFLRILTLGQYGDPTLPGVKRPSVLSRASLHVPVCTAAYSSARPVVMATPTSRRTHWLTSVQTGDGSSGTVSNATSTLMWSTGRVSIAGLPPAAGMISSHAQAGPALVPVTVNVCAFRPADGLL